MMWILATYCVHIFLSFNVTGLIVPQALAHIEQFVVVFLFELKMMFLWYSPPPPPQK